MLRLAVEHRSVCVWGATTLGWLTLVTLQPLESELCAMTRRLCVIFFSLAHLCFAQHVPVFGGAWQLLRQGPVTASSAENEPSPRQGHTAAGGLFGKYMVIHAGT